MYRTSNGYWKSDFKIRKIRYQKTWSVKDKKKALKLEEEWKNKIIQDKYLSYRVQHNKNDDFTEQITSIKDMTFDEAKEYLYQVKWKFFKDKNNPLSRWKRISKYFGNNKSLSKLTIDDLDRFKEFLVGNSYANKTINHYISTLKTSIELLESRQKIVLENKLSFEGMRLPTYENRKICFTREEERLMSNAFLSRYRESGCLKDWEMLQFFIINSGLGLRPAEYLNLQLGDIDFEERVLTISRGGYNSTKNNLIRTLPIDGVVFDSIVLLVKYSIAHIYSDKTISKLYNLDTLSTEKLTLLISQYDCKNTKLTTLTKEMIRKRWNKMKNTLGWTDKETYKEYIPYGLRHTVASRLASRIKWNGYRIMRFMGHKSFHTSLNYIHLDVDDIREGACVNNQDIENTYYGK